MAELKFADRLRAVIGDEPPTRWATDRGISGATMHEWLTKDTTPYPKSMAKLVAGTGIPEEWWLKGNLPPPAAGTPQGSDLQPCRPTVAEAIHPQQDYDEWAKTVPVADAFVPVRYYRNARVSAGHGANNGNERPDALLFSKSFLRTLGSAARDLFLVRVEGDSMLPTLQAGWTVMLDTARTTVSSGIYVIRLGDEEMCKRLEVRPGGKVRVISDNKFYDEYEIDAERIGTDFAVLGKVVWFAGVMQ